MVRGLLQVVSRKITPTEALAQFLDQWDTKEKDGIVTFDEFVEYYNDVSASIDEDDYFELMIRHAPCAARCVLAPRLTTVVCARAIWSAGMRGTCRAAVA